VPTTVLTIDEYIFLNWVRSLTEEQRTVLLKHLQSGEAKPNTLSPTLLESYPHNLLDIATAICRD